MLLFWKMVLVLENSGNYKLRSVEVVEFNFTENASVKGTCYENYMCVFMMTSNPSCCSADTI